MCNEVLSVFRCSECVFKLSEWPRYQSEKIYSIPFETLLFKKKKKDKEKKKRK